MHQNCVLQIEVAAEYLDQELSQLINWFLQEIPIDYIEIASLTTALATTILAIACFTLILRRNKILTLKGVAIIFNLFALFATISDLMIVHFLFDNQNEHHRIHLAINSFVVLQQLLVGLILICRF